MLGLMAAGRCPLLPAERGFRTPQPRQVPFFTPIPGKQRLQPCFADPLSRKPNPPQRGRDPERLHHPRHLHPEQGCHGRAMRGSGEQGAAGTAYLIGAGVLYQRWAAATAPYHLPQNTGRRSHTEGRGTLPTQPQASNLPQGQAAGQALTWMLGGEWELVSFWEQFRGFCAKTEKVLFFFDGDKEEKKSEHAKTNSEDRKSLKYSSETAREVWHVRSG